MKKSILKTILFLTIIGASSLVNAQKKKLSIKGDEEICLQNNETFEYEYSTRKFKSIHWSATNGTDIKSVDGFDLKAVIEDFISGNTFNNDIPFIVSDLKLHKRKRSIETSLTFPEGAQVFALKDGFGVQYLGLKYFVIGVILDTSKIIDGNYTFQISKKYKDYGISRRVRGCAITVAYTVKDSVNYEITAQSEKKKIAFNKSGSATKLVEVLSKPGDLYLTSNFIDTVNCNESISFSVLPKYESVKYEWVATGFDFENGSFKSDGDRVEVGGFNAIGPKHVMVKVQNKCGVKEVSKPFFIEKVEPNLKPLVSGVELEGDIIRPNCTVAESGLELSLNGSSNFRTKYKWSLPAGWEFVLEEDNITSTELGSDGLTTYQYQFSSYHSLILRKKDAFASSGAVVLELDGFCEAENKHFLAINIEAPNYLDIELPEMLGSCNDSIVLNPDLLRSGTKPYTITWSVSDNLNTFFTKGQQQNNVSDLTNVLKSKNFSNNMDLEIKVTDSLGCSDRAVSKVNFFGQKAGSSVSGWMSKELYLNSTDTIIDKVVMDEFNHIIYYAVYKSEKAEFWAAKYDFQLGNWVKSKLNLSVFGTSIYNMQIIPNHELGRNLIAFQNQNGLNTFFVSTYDNQLIANSHKIVQGFSTFKFVDSQSDKFEALWTEALGDFNYGVFKVENFDFSLMEGSKKVVSKVNGNVFFSGVVKSFFFFRDKCFYIKDDDNLYYKMADSESNFGDEVKLTNLFGVNSVILKEDNSGNIYFVKYGKLNIIKFTNEIFDAVYEIEPKDDIYISGNSFAINKNQNTIYFKTDGGKIYQMVRGENFEQSPNFVFYQATPSGVRDNANTIYDFDRGANQLIYKNNNSSLSHLYIFKPDDYQSCYPNQYRVADGTSYSIKQEKETLDVTQQLYPNPASDVLTIDVKKELDALATLQVFDMQGVLLQEMEYGFEPTLINVSGLEIGVYIVKITSSTSKNPLSFKFVKQ